jgi:hypothetical protein
MLGRRAGSAYLQVPACCGCWFVNHSPTPQTTLPRSPIIRPIGLSMRRQSHHPKPDEHEKPKHADAMGKEDQSSDRHDDPT